ncbi:MAG TPA: hypothetical protein VKC63_04950 [Solirubrobacterales bacterium]|nr:hypothetical protein [Solirubrobacterales bacterium]
MSRGKRVRAGVAAPLLALAIAGLVAIPAGATKTVSISSTLQISAYGYFGKVKSPNSGCVEDRSVVLKQKGYGVLGRDTSDGEGRWKVDPETLHYKGKLPFKIYAEAKPLSQGAAGTIYKCLAATSKTITINGG